MADENKPETTPNSKPEMVAVPPKGKSNNKTLLIVVGVVVFVFVILPIILFTIFALWLGSGDNAENLTEKTIESATGSNVDINSEDGSFSVQNQDGDEFSVGGEQDYAEDFPSEIPKYPGGTVVSNVRSDSETSTYWSNNVTTSDSPEKALAYFEEEMKDWEKGGSYTINDSTSVTYTKGNLELLLSVGSNDGVTNVTYSATEKK